MNTQPNPPELERTIRGLYQREERLKVLEAEHTIAMARIDMLEAERVRERGELGELALDRDRYLRLATELEVRLSAVRIQVEELLEACDLTLRAARLVAYEARDAERRPPSHDLEAGRRADLAERIGEELEGDGAEEPARPMPAIASQ